VTLKTIMNLVFLLQLFLYILIKQNNLPNLHFN